MYIIILENEGFWAMKVTIFQIFSLRRATLVKKVCLVLLLTWVTGPIMDTNFKNFHFQQDYIFFLILK